MPPADVASDLAAARSELTGLGARPPGDPGAIRQLARQARKEADNAATAGRIEKGLPGSMVFEGPAATRFAGNSGEVAESLFTAQRTLDDAATQLEHAAHALAEKQRAYDKRRHSIEGRIRSLSSVLSAGSR